VCDAGHPLNHRAAVIINERLALLIARLALERARAAKLLAALDVLALQDGDQIIAVDRLPTAHAELGQRVIGPEPQRRSARAASARLPTSTTTFDSVSICLSVHR
jgi:hypothetical protein